VSRFGFARVVELGPDQSVEHRRVDITAIKVRHGDTRAPANAYVIRGDGPSVFFCGASGYFGGFSGVGQRFGPDIALLPISGYSPKSFRKQHMTPPEAVAAFEDLRSKIMIPIRHGAFALSYERLFDPPFWLREVARDQGLEDYIVPLDAGQSRVFVFPRRDAHLPRDRAGEPERDDAPEAPGARAAPEEPGPREENAA
jgi:L-ascorbate metabolism protein UlaG (beta-lactamase superfamily)